MKLQLFKQPIEPPRLSTAAIDSITKTLQLRVSPSWGGMLGKRGWSSVARWRNQEVGTMAHMYCVILEEPDEGIRKAIENSDMWRYRLNDRSFLIESTKDSKAIVEDIGLGSEPDATAGVIFRLNGSYSGFYYNSLWETLRSRGTA